MAAITRILVPLDLGESSRRTLDYARTLARPFQASLHVMHVVPNPYVTMASEAYMPAPQDFLDELESEARHRLNGLLTDGDRAELKAETLVVIGDPLCAIVDHATQEKIDLIVMGTHGRTGVAHLMLGSVAERVVRTAPCPVLARPVIPGWGRVVECFESRTEVHPREVLNDDTEYRVTRRRIVHRLPAQSSCRHHRRS